ncbi:MAG: hypothetical protein NXI04_24910 [Planctomycetaceae bacterium]|nr:hypothetical protein [Planctomycetaceae bacterium]
MAAFLDRWSARSITVSMAADNDGLAAVGRSRQFSPLISGVFVQKTGAPELRQSLDSSALHVLQNA